MKARRPLTLVLAVAVALAASYVVLRKCSTLVRPYYPAQTIAVNPAGTCAIAEYLFRGGERWNWTDPYRWFVLAPQDAFYTVTDLRTGQIIRDSTTQVFPSIAAYSLAAVAMGKDTFYWNKDGTSVNFPAELDDSAVYEWTDIDACAGTTRASEFTNLVCNGDDKSPRCARLRGRL